MEPKKISFGFSKTIKKSIIIPSKVAQKQEEVNKVELIKCLEGQEIKLVEEKKDEAPMVIPLKESQKTSAALASLMKRRAVLLDEDEPLKDDSGTKENGMESDLIIKETDNIEQRAAKELLADIKANGSEIYSSDLVLPVVHPDDLPLEGAKESSLDDYDDIPIEQFGKAMLRGMGWVEPPKPAKGTVPLDDDLPMVRPKGMGLGADKALKAKPLLVPPESNEVLAIKRNAFVRILGGKHKDLYGQIEGFDDHAGRVIVKMAIGGFKETFNEFLCQPVSKKEYAQYGKCINSTKYEEYKRKENEHGQIILKKEELAEIEKKSVKYEKIKKESRRHSSDDDCKIIEKKPIKTEQNIDESEKNYKEEKNFKKDYKRENKEFRSKEEKSENYRDSDKNRKRDDEDKYRGREKYKEEEYNRGKEGEKKSSNRQEERNKNENPKDLERSHKRDSDEKYKDYRRGNEDESKSSYEQNRYRDRSPRNSYENKGNISKRDYDERGNRSRDNEERKYLRHQYNENSSQESQSDDGSRHKKYHKDKKHKKKKSKKSKKNKAKYSSDSDNSDPSSENDDSDSEDNRRRKHKKKTKKSKKERERSRSRGRR